MEILSFGLTHHNSLVLFFKYLFIFFSSYAKEVCFFANYIFFISKNCSHSQLTSARFFWNTIKWFRKKIMEDMNRLVVKYNMLKKWYVKRRIKDKNKLRGLYYIIHHVVYFIHHHLRISWPDLNFQRVITWNWRWASLLTWISKYTIEEVFISSSIHRTPFI